MFYQLIMGYTLGTFLAVLWPDGTRRLAGHRIARWLAEHDGRRVRCRTGGPLGAVRTTIADPTQEKRVTGGVGKKRD